MYSCAKKKNCVLYTGQKIIKNNKIKTKENIDEGRQQMSLTRINYYKFAYRCCYLRYPLTNGDSANQPLQLAAKKKKIEKKKR